MSSEAFLSLPDGVPLEQKQVMLNSLQERKGILIPPWWKGTPQAFRDEFNVSLQNVLKHSPKNIPTARMQLASLEVLLDMWDEARSRIPTR